MEEGGWWFTFNKRSFWVLLPLIFAAAILTSFVANADSSDSDNSKLNKKTKDYLEKVADVNEGRDYLVKFRVSVIEDKVGKASIEKKYDRFKTAKITAKAKDIGEMLADPEIEYIELDQKIEPMADTVVWGVSRTEAPLIWSQSVGNGASIAILDTGVSSHSDLSVSGGVSVVSDDYSDSHGHGTAVAGVISSLLNGEGLVGIAPEAELYAVKIMEGPTGQLSDAISGVEWAIDNNIDIVSMSFGMETYSQIFREVLEEAYNSNILLIAAAGNTGEEGVLYPAAYETVIAVGATDENNNIAAFSSYGNELELAAPGVAINSTGLDDTYAVSSGTSMAAPHVAGVAALIKSYNYSLTNGQIRAKLRNDALDLGISGRDDYYGYGLVQANLYDWNFSLVNDSYFYEIFNITNYGTPEEQRIFWVNGTGIVDDVEFGIGLYLVRKRLKTIEEQILNVTENSTISALAPFQLELFDDYTHNCSPNCNKDGVAWKNGVLKAYIAPDSQSDKRTECFDWTNDGISDDCYGTESEMANCDDVPSFFNWCDETVPSCTPTNSNLGNHSISTGVAKSEELDSAACYYDNGYKFDGQANKFYYIREKRQFICTSNTQYEDRCLNSTDSTLKVMNTLTCPTNYHCDTSLDGENADYGSSGASTPAAPCVPDFVPPLCNGTIEVNAEDNAGSALKDLSVYVNGTFNSSTSVIGQARISFGNAQCGASQEITVKCSDNATICGIQSAQIDLNNDTDYLGFDCTVCSATDDLYFSQSDVNVSESDDSVNVTVHSAGLTTKFNISVRRQDENGIIQEAKLNAVAISAGLTNKTTFTFSDLEDTDFLHIYIDANNTVRGEREDNNYIFRAIV